MQKLKVAAAIFGCVLALAALFVPAFAVDPDYDPELTFNTDTPLEPMQLPGGLLGDPAVTTASEPFIDRAFGSSPGFTLSYVGSDPLVRDSDGYNALRGFLYNAGINSAAKAVGYCKCVVTSGSTVEGSIFGTSTSIGVAVYSAAAATIYRVELPFSDDTLKESAQALETYGFRVTSNDGIGKALGTQIWNFGDNLITFVKSHFIVMIPLVIWLLVVAISAIKKIADPEG